MKNNYAEQSGGCIYCMNPLASINIDNCSITRNMTGGDGGGIYHSVYGGENTQLNIGSNISFYGNSPEDIYTYTWS